MSEKSDWDLFYTSVKTRQQALVCLLFLLEYFLLLVPLLVRIIQQNNAYWVYLPYIANSQSVLRLETKMREVVLLRSFPQ